MCQLVYKLIPSIIIVSIYNMFRMHSEYRSSLWMINNNMFYVNAKHNKLFWNK